MTSIRKMFLTILAVSGIAMAAFFSPGPAAGGLSQCVYTGEDPSCEDICKDPGAPSGCCAATWQC